MKRLWDNINDSKYFTYFAVVVLGVIKLLFDNFKSNDTYLHLAPLIQTITISVYVIAILHFGLFLLTIRTIYLRFDKSFEEWQKENKGKKIEQLINKLLIRPAWLTLVIVIYGFFIFLTLSVFSWTDFFVFFGTIVTFKIIRTFYNLRKDRPRQEV